MTPVYGRFAGSSQVCGANSPEEVGIYVCLTTNHSNSQNIVLKPGVAVHSCDSNIQDIEPRR